MGITLRPFHQADLPALHALDQVCFAPGIAYTRAELRAFLEHPSSFSAVATRGDATLGFAIVRPLRRKPTGAQPWARAQPVLHLLTIDVAPNARRQGIGALLMRWAVAKGVALRSRAIVLEVAVDNAAAQRFYQAFGFKPADIIPCYYNDVTDALRMELSLAGDHR